MAKISGSGSGKSRSAGSGGGGGRKKSPAQMDREIAAIVKPRRGGAYRLQLTPGEVSALEMTRGRYSWPDMLLAHVADDGLVIFSESEMHNWCDDVNDDDGLFPMASPLFTDKLQRFYDSVV